MELFQHEKYAIRRSYYEAGGGQKKDRIPIT
jgi:hypothetical protein